MNILAVCTVFSDTAEYIITAKTRNSEHFAISHYHALSVWSFDYQLLCKQMRISRAAARAAKRKFQKVSSNNCSGVAYLGLARSSFALQSWLEGVSSASCV